ncbi:seryl-tRNA synthetase [Indibacter alkaliphilus]|jgi:pyridoxine 5'-phosphate synthase PdxJ|uniref:seryl-tRNA synthetase n=1 Tax=Indibacter alkaliphilus TaxID=579922 RepID=UPI00028221FA|nr:seryl-tRNA synthetase [Indibacter alkaliphilus]
MKKHILNFSLAAALMLGGTSASLAADKPAKAENELTEAQVKRLEEIDARVLEIKEMDFSEMDRAERKEIKSELKELHKEAKQNGGSGIYISTGALIIIIILLIILL